MCLCYCPTESRTTIFLYRISKENELRVSGRSIHPLKGLYKEIHTEQKIEMLYIFTSGLLF